MVKVNVDVQKVCLMISASVTDTNDSRENFGIFTLSVENEERRGRMTLSTFTKVSENDIVVLTMQRLDGT